MENRAAFTLYNASAGAGKTFTLVKNYLYLLLGDTGDFNYRNILAVTFTNKAVAEMKARILKNLDAFSTEKIIEEPTAMFESLCEMTGLAPTALHKKALRVYENVLQDYSSFDVVTIDNFTHRIIRTFAKDLRIPQHFQVEMNTQDVLQQAVNRVIDKIGTDEMLTHVLIAYTLEKIDDDKSWDIGRELMDTARLLLNEDDQYYLSFLQDKNLKDFSALKDHLSTTIKEGKLAVITEATQLQQHFTALGLQAKNFMRGYLPKRLAEWMNGNINGNLGTSWIKNIATAPLYASKEAPEIKTVLDAQQPFIAEKVTAIVKHILHIRLHQNLHKRIVPLSVLSLINKEIQAVKKENNVLLISDFNQVIHKNIVNEPTPFIYERLGERYRHYFIDEFQDTSLLQWSNMVPLIDNVLSADSASAMPNSLLLVGDPKQAIYRWRGGNVSQFLKLAAKEDRTFLNPSKELVHLPTNYRSYDQVIQFNNDFFQYIAQFLSKDVFRELFMEGCNQKFNDKEGGHVSIQLVTGKTKDEVLPQYLAQSENKVREVLTNGFAKGEICILVRKNEQGVQIANHLQEAGIEVVSGQSLLLKHSREVMAVIYALRLLQEEDDKMSAIKLLEYVADHNEIPGGRHQFFKRQLAFAGPLMFRELSNFGISFHAHQCLEMPLYEAVEYIARSFDLYDRGGVQLQFLLDHAHSYAQKNSDGIYGFLRWFDQNKELLNISTPETVDAVKIMTIHKAKGLEFPVVIYPFAEDDLQRRGEQLDWYPTTAEDYSGFEYLLVNYSSAVAEINETTAALYDEKISLEELDRFNELYVALTRAVEQLHIITRLETQKPQGQAPKKISDFFQRFLAAQGKFEEGKTHFTFNDAARVSTAPSRTSRTQKLQLFSNDRNKQNLQLVTHPLLADDMPRVALRARGELLHAILAEIEQPSQISKVVADYLNKGLLSQAEAGSFLKALTQTIEQLRSKGYFQEGRTVYTERDLIYGNQILRPDRVEINEANEAYLIDYKSGKPNPAYEKQLSLYASALQKAGFKVVQKELVFLEF